MHKSNGVQSNTQLRVKLFSNLGQEKTTQHLLEFHQKLAAETENLSNVEPSDTRHGTLQHLHHYQIFNPKDLDNGARIPAIGTEPPEILIQLNTNEIPRYSDFGAH